VGIVRLPPHRYSFKADSSPFGHLHPLLDPNPNLVLSAEEVTALRRQERKDFKIARAKAAVATVEAAERALLLSLPTDPTSTSSPSSSTAALIPDEVVKPVRPGNTKYGNERELLEEELARQEEVEAKTENLEHLQLIPEEVWFLAWGLGCLNVLSPTEVCGSVSLIFMKLFC
jgi:tRNA-splicing endonuclease subunit Sen2